MLVFDRECRALVWNPGMERIFGVSAAEVMGRSVLDALPFLIEHGEEGLLREALDGRHASVLERPFRVEATGRSGLYEAHVSPWRSDAGEVQGGILLVRDVTSGTRAEQQLRETESRFRNMADAAPVLLWMSRTDGLCTFFNQTWLDFTGRSLEEEWGVGWAEGVHFEDFQRCMDGYLAAFGARRRFELEYRLRRRDGEYRWILDRGTPRYSPDGTFAGYIGSCVDITERKQLEVDLRQAVRVRDEFLSMASHELRTPLTTLQLRVESLMRTLEIRPQEGLASGRIARNGAVALQQVLHLGDMVSVLLDVSRIGEGKLALDCEDVDLAALVRRVVARLRQAAADAGCRLDLHSAEEAVGRCDRFRVEQVVTNLLTNAIKYGAGKPVEVALRRSNGSAQLAVTDHGPGIAREHQRRLFERFARFAPTRHYGGFGLGLWIAREIVQAHGGQIRVDSRPGEGASFVVELPLKVAHLGPD
jgi:PAS domain S-box-containing protein